MTEEIYSPQEIGIESADKDSFFTRIWEGRIKLWKAFWLVHILGLLVSLALGMLPQLLVMAITEARLPHFFTFIPFAIVFPITLVCLWRSAPNPKISIKGALIKMWVCLAAVYYFVMLFRALSGPL